VADQLIDWRCMMGRQWGAQLDSFTAGEIEGLAERAATGAPMMGRVVP
jgi:hypothetical protein